MNNTKIYKNIIFNFGAKSWILFVYKTYDLPLKVHPHLLPPGENNTVTLSNRKMEVMILALILCLTIASIVLVRLKNYRVSQRSRKFKRDTRNKKYTTLCHEVKNKKEHREHKYIRGENAEEYSTIEGVNISS